MSSVQRRECLTGVRDSDDDGSLEGDCEGAEAKACHGSCSSRVAQHSNDLVGRDRHDTKRREESLKVACKLFTHPQARLHSSHKHVNLQPPPLRLLKHKLLQHAVELCGSAPVESLRLMPVCLNSSQHPRDIPEVSEDFVAACHQRRSGIDDLSHIDQAPRSPKLRPKHTSHRRMEPHNAKAQRRQLREGRKPGLRRRVA
mmetsp:Transcript_24474/g.47605  ORF Transcript_24474/g.47605 Transcript_24474/m.47605 type:complete len:200 (-) Transcript_24474:222-821(-)